MNYSTTAEKMYVHINTIRKRIEKVNDLIEIHWEDSISRLKTEILLQFLKLER
ncbi:helix-turn-helix domain-containing protein [Anaerostipes sp. MSJ-23]|uniref:helix-turn-helix domain-containing protein n=1 Tax=Anaerostipes sp. MSJ-23 TaxID=2841520 RepID=UPI00209FAC2E|nr:helix-turn-helix domain-containing protein [Anaerostipes sp. MSJ-23]